MLINISTRHGHLSEASQQKIREKVSKLERFHDRLTSIEVTVNLEHEDSPEVEIQVSAERKHDFVAAQRSSELMSCLDAVVHKVEQQIKKYKERSQQKHRSNAAKSGIDRGEPASPSSDETGL